VAEEIAVNINVCNTEGDPFTVTQIDDIVTRLRSVLDPEMPLSERLAISDAITEIERLRNKEQDLRMLLEQDACVIERLTAKTDDR
jgi:hypothetical protein